MIQRDNIQTLQRFIYLNAYAILLLVVGVGIGVIPLYKISFYLLIPQILLVIVFIKGSYGIFTSWEDKKRKYVVLMERNSKCFRPDTFSEYMQAPCGRLLVKIVLEDLDQSDKYKMLRKQRQPFFKELKNNCATKEVKVYTMDDYKK